MLAKSFSNVGRLWLVFFAMICISCHSTDVSERDVTHIILSRDSQLVCVSGIDYSILQQFKKDSLTTEAYQRILSVYRMPADTDMKDYQNEQPGIYNITGSLITFKPDTPFKKHQTYFARFYGHAMGNMPTDLAQGKGNLKAPKFTEVIFKF